ncbi:MAG: terminase small subunit [Rhodoferax sp.]|nr:terminase small subunit [Rhodoferax sp.]
MEHQQKQRRLTSQQEAFCLGIVGGLSQYAAYLQAYPGSKKWERNAVDSMASQLCSTPKIAQRLAEHRKALEQVSILKAAEVLAEIRRIVHGDPRGIMHPDGRVKRLHELDADTAATVSSYEDGEGGIKYRFWDKNAALEKAAKYLGLYERDNKQKVTPLEELIASLGRSAFPVAKGTT